MATINIRVDENLKNKSEEILGEIGINMTAAMTIFLKAVVRNNGIPFPLEIPNNRTKKSFKHADEIISGKAKARKYKNSAELRKDLGV